MTVFALICLVLSGWAMFLGLINLLVFRAPRVVDNLEKPRASILLPARDEEGNIENAVRAALASRGVELEVIVLDDHSKDQTAEIVRKLATEDERVRLVEGEDLPSGWAGKVFACHQLSRAAIHPWMLFVDCDVELQPDALRAMIDYARDAKAKPGLISGLPRELTGSWLEHLLIPMIHFVIIAMLPIPAMRRLRNKSLTASVGQILLAEKTAYERAGGHDGIRLTFHDGMRLAESFREIGIATDIVDLTHLARCRMYHDAKETWNGLLKNAHEGMGAPGTIGQVTLLLLMAHVIPWLLLPFASGSALIYAASAAGLSLTLRVMTALRFRQSFLGAIFHPIGVVILIAIQWIGLVRHLRGRRTEWKGRSLS